LKITGRNWKTASPVLFAAQPNTPSRKGMSLSPMKPNKKIDALTRLISKAEDQETAIKKLEEAESLARKNLTEAEKLESAAANDKKAPRKPWPG
jgi:exonuclease SbcC